MVALPSCSHPEDAREPLPYDGHNAADPDDWRCAECGVTNLRLDRRSYEDRLAAAEAERLAEIEFERFAERQTPSYRTRELDTREGRTVVAVPEYPAMNFSSQSVAEVLQKLMEVSGVEPVISQHLDLMDVPSVFDTVKEAISTSREVVIQGGFDPSKSDADLTALFYVLHDAGSLALKHVDRLEFSHELFHRSMIMSQITDYSAFSFDSNRNYRMMNWNLVRKDLPPFAFRIVGS